MIEPERFRQVMASWPSGVTIVACRDESRVVATTVSAFLSLSLQPPQILVAIGPNATVRPFLTPGAPFGVSVLAAHHRRLASVYADPFPVGPDPFTTAGAPLVEDALVGLHCTVESLVPASGHVLVVAGVHEAEQHEAPALIRYRRQYHTLDL